MVGLGCLGMKCFCPVGLVLDWKQDRDAAPNPARNPGPIDGASLGDILATERFKASAELGFAAAGTVEGF